MLNFPKDQLPVLSHGKRRAAAPEADGDATDIESRPAKRPHLDSPAQSQTCEPSITSMKPVVRAPDTAPHALWSIAPPVAQPSLPRPLPVWRGPSHDVAQILKAWRQISPATVKRTRLDVLSSTTTELPGIAQNPCCDHLSAQVFEPTGSMGIIASTTVTTTTPTAAPTSAVTHPARQLRAVSDALRSAGPVPDGEDVEPVSDERFEWIARRVCDAKQVELQNAIATIKDADFHSPRAVTVWFQLCAVLCLHYDDQQEKEPLWQCLERILLRIASIRLKPFRELHDVAKTSLLATSIPAGFIRILEQAQASKWREGRLLKVFYIAQIKATVTVAIKQVAAGLHPEKTAQQAAADFLLARYAARAAHTAQEARAACAAHPAPAVAPSPPEEINRFETVDPEFPFMFFFGEDIIDSDPLPEFWWLADGDNLAAHAFEPDSESTSTATTTTATTPTPAVTRTAPQLPAAPDAQRHDEFVADGDNERTVTGRLLNG